MPPPMPLRPGCRAQCTAMANFLRVTDRVSLQVRNLNVRYVIEIAHDADTGGATVYYVSYAIAGQPVTKYIDAAETVEALLAQLPG